MKKGIVILLCLLFTSCSRYTLREEKIKEINAAVQLYYDNDVKSVIRYYHRPPSHLLPDTLIIAEDLNWTLQNCLIKPAQVKFAGQIMSAMEAEGLVAFTNQPATQYGDYYFHLSREINGQFIIYMAFKKSNKWHMLAIPVN